MRRYLFRTNKNIKLFLALFFSYISAHWKQFLFGLVIGSSLILLLPILNAYLISKPTSTVGIVGNFTIDNFPKIIQNKVSFGLVTLSPEQIPQPAAAKSWEILDSGKTVKFALNTDLKWSDGKPFTSDQVNFSLKGVKISRETPSSITFSLPDAFSPLVTLLSQPLLKNGVTGLRSGKIDDLRLNGRFVSSLKIDDTIYKFYPDEKTLITALKLGSVRQAINLHKDYKLSMNYFKTDYSIDSKTMAVIFFNTQKAPFDDKSFRQGLIYALPDNFDQGEIAHVSIIKNSWAQSNQAKIYIQNIDTAKKLTQKSSSVSANLKITLGVNQGLEPTADIVARSWKQVGIDVNVAQTDFVQMNYDAYLTYLELPDDPDEYYLWHSTQQGNISGYKSPKIDKLLEEGRRVNDINQRKDIYAQFQKAITEDAPAAFLFYPKIYSISRI